MWQSFSDTGITTHPVLHCSYISVLKSRCESEIAFRNSPAGKPIPPFDFMVISTGQCFLPAMVVIRISINFRAKKEDHYESRHIFYRNRAHLDPDDI